MKIRFEHAVMIMCFAAMSPVVAADTEICKHGTRYASCEQLAAEGRNNVVRLPRVPRQDPALLEVQLPDAADLQKLEHRAKEAILLLDERKRDYCDAAEITEEDARDGAQYLRYMARMFVAENAMSAAQSNFEGILSELDKLRKKRSLPPKNLQALPDPVQFPKAFEKWEATKRELAESRIMQRGKRPWHRDNPEISMLPSRYGR